MVWPIVERLTDSEWLCLQTIGSSLPWVAPTSRPGPDIGQVTAAAAPIVCGGAAVDAPTTNVIGTCQPDRTPPTSRSEDRAY